MAGTMRFELGVQSGLAAIPNRLDLDGAALLANLRTVQARSRITPDSEVKFIDESIETASGEKTVRFASFSVEMETGTIEQHSYAPAQPEVLEGFL